MNRTLLLVILLVLASGCSEEMVERNYATILNTTFCPHGGCGKLFAYLIRSSKESVQCAFYDIEEGEVLEALKDVQSIAHVIIDPRADEKTPDWFTVADVPSLMHHKFCVLDHEIVITGSMNPTWNGMYRNNNNLVVLFSPSLASKYERRFEELLYDRKCISQPWTSDDLSVRSYMCRCDDCKSAVWQVLSKAKHEILVMAFSFTDRDLGELLLYLQNIGKEVRLLVEKRNMASSDALEFMIAAGMNVTSDTNTRTMHHKVFIIDNKTVITGSPNPTGGGYGRNEEDMLIIRDSSVAAQFREEFIRLLGKNISCTRSSLQIESVLPDPFGKDSGQEKVVIINTGQDETVADGCTLETSSSVHKVRGVVPEGGILQVTFPRSILRNRNGSVSLICGIGTLDSIGWNEQGFPSVKQGDCLLRTDHKDVCSSSSWIVDNSCLRTKTFLNTGTSPQVSS